MTTRRNVERRRDIIIHKEQWTEKIKAQALIDAAKQMTDDEYVMGMAERTGRHVPFGSMDSEEVYFHNHVLVVAKMELENDEEFFNRVQKEEAEKKAAAEREKETYLRLKAKYGHLEPVDGKLPNIEEEAYTYTQETVTHKHYNPAFGDDRICKCGHSYYRHFDSWENMYPIGCKYCQCGHFEEATPEEIANFPEDI
jgi:hypothetical protein